MPHKQKNRSSTRLSKTALPATEMKDAAALKMYLAARLPEMLSLALDAYDLITSQPVAEDPRAFTAQQAGAKAALTHMQALLKLAQSVMMQSDANGQEGIDHRELSALLKRAKEAVHDFEYMPDEGDEITGGV